MECKRFFCALVAFLLVGANIVSAAPAFAAEGDANGDESVSEGAEADANINNLTEELDTEEPEEEPEEEPAAEPAGEEEPAQPAAATPMLGGTRNAAAVVTTSDELIAALEAGGSVQLGDDITVTDGDWACIYGEAALDLNGHTVTFGHYYSDLYVSGGKLTISGEGKLVKTAAQDIVWVVNGGEVIIESGAIEGVDYAIYAGADWDTTGGKVTMNGGSITVDGWGIVGIGNSEVEFNGGTINAGSGIGISGNGSADCAGAKFTINGGTINAALGVYAPQIDGVTIINDGVINGSEAGIEIRAGDLTINGGTISVPADVAYTTAANGSGSTTTGAAISVAQHTTQQEINVTINGGTFTAPVPFSETNPQGNPAPAIENVTVVINDGTFNATSDDAVISEDFEKFITGGTYSEAPAEEQLDDGKDAYEVPAENDAHVWVVDNAANVNLPTTPILIQKGDTFDFSIYLDAIAKQYGTLGTDHPEFMTIADWMIAGNATGAALINFNLHNLVNPVDSTIEAAVWSVKPKASENIDEENATKLAEMAAKSLKKYLEDGEADNAYFVYDLIDAILSDPDLYATLDIYGITNDEEEGGLEDFLRYADEVCPGALDGMEVIAAYEVYASLFNEDWWLADFYELDTPIKFRLAIPEGYDQAPEGYTRKFMAVRFHEEPGLDSSRVVYEVLDAELVDGFVELESDKFSEYAIAYKDEPTPVAAEAPETGAHTEDENAVADSAATVIAAIAVAATLFGVVKFSKKNR